MNIELICPYPFPIGLSATNRIVTYTKGLVENDNNVKIIISRPTERNNDIKNVKVKGNYCGIEYQYSWFNTIWPSSFCKKVIIYYLAVLLSFFLLYRDNLTKKFDCLISSCDSGFVNIGLFLLTKLIHCKFIYIVDEYPNPIRYNKKPSIIRKFSIDYTSRLFDGLIVMTFTLEEFFKNRIRKDAKLFVMPMTVECERFIENNDVPSLLGNYITYIGELGGNKDGVCNLIESFQMITKDFQDIKLCIIGSARNEKEYNKYNELIFKYKLKERIVFTGGIHRDKVPSYLNNALLLALARPNTVRSQGGFPTKLGEYLATGRPVVCTAVGEIPYYLTDGKNAFLVEPDNNEKFAEKLKYVLENPKLAEKVGKEGQKVALSVFNYRVQAKQMNDFLKTV